MRYPLKRHYGRGDLHFITFSCYHRQPFLGTAGARDSFLNMLDEVRCRHAFELIGYVVMPEHVHLLVSEPAEISPSKALQVLKQKVAQVLMNEDQDAASRTAPLKPKGAAPKFTGHFWQRRFYDFNVWSEKKVREKLDYMHANPVRRKLVLHPDEWPWSSWAHYAKGEPGIIRIDSLREEGKETAKTAPSKPERAAPELLSG
jgi:putative transposase